MASKRTTRGSRSAVIRCPNCGEDYSVTYKRCPFCDEKADKKPRAQEGGEDQDLLEEGAARGGKRLLGGGRRGGGEGAWTTGRIVRTALSVVVILAAVGIVVTQVMPLVDRGSQVAGSQPPSTDVVEEVPPSESLPAESGPVEASPAPETAPPASEPPETQAPETPEPPSDQTATGLTLSRADFTMNDRYPDPVRLVATLTPAGSTGTVTWTSSDPDVATVDSSGLVSRGTKNGQTTITASLPDGTSESCTVRCSFTSASTPQGASSSSGSLSLNRSDFTLQREGETFRMRVSGTSSTPSWSIGDTSVATVASDGTVTAVGEGHTTLTCSVDGQSLTCIVRCDF